MELGISQISISKKKIKMKSRMTKKQKVEITISSLFGELPDEMVLTILSYGEMDDIQSSRVWQSKKVQHWTDTRSNWEASVNNNLDNLKWIYDFIGDTDFTRKSDSKLNCTGNVQILFILFYI